MTDEQWERVWDIFRVVQELPDDQRQSYVCSVRADPEVREELISLLSDSAEEQGNPSFPQAGDRIGRYEIVEKLARGGMGQVFRARDTELGRIVALKFLAPDVIATHGMLERLVREAQAASALNHPHIVTVYEVVRSNNNLGIAMELVEGKPLREFCSTPQPAGHVIDWGRQVAQALAAAHERGIIHRDIKPENVMIRPDGYVKVLDFGLARMPNLNASQSNRTAGGFAGTLNYMSPEQVRGESATPASDVFSLGVVLYELATGRHPFRVASPIETAHAIVHNEPKAARSWNGDLPPAMNSLLAAMLAKRPLERPSAADVERDLAPNEAPAVGRRSQGRRWLIAAFIMALLLPGAGFWLLRARLFGPKEPMMTQLTSQAIENRVIAAAISPDGSDLAFAVFRGPIYLKRLSDGLTRPLHTPEGLRVDRIAWFNDGKHLLVSGRQPPNQAGIWELQAGDGEPRLVAPNCKDGVPSPDGTRIAATNTGGSMLWIVNRDGRAARQTRSGGVSGSFSSLIWSPDGKRIGYQRQDLTAPDRSDPESARLEHFYKFSYESIDVESERVVASVKDIVMISAAGLPDGRILFLRWTPVSSLNYQLWEMRTDPDTGRVSGPPRRLTSRADLSLFGVSATEDGGKVVVVWQKVQPNVYVADLSLSSGVPRFTNRRRLSFSEADSYPHAWTKDNQSVIFESDRDGPFQLFRQEIGQRDATPLVLGPGNSVLEQISPEGRWVLYQNMEGRNSRLMRISVDGGKSEVVPLASGPNEFRCALQRNGRCVLRATKNDEFVFYELDPVLGQGRELARTAATPFVLGDWDISPDGSQIAIPNHDPREAKIRLLTFGEQVPGAGEKTITLSGVQYLNGVVWTADGNGFFAAARTSAGGGLLLFADLNGRVTEILESSRTTYAVPSSDGRRVAYPDAMTSSNAWMLRGF